MIAYINGSCDFAGEWIDNRDRPGVKVGHIRFCVADKMNVARGGESGNLSHILKAVCVDDINLPAVIDHHISQAIPDGHGECHISQRKGVDINGRHRRIASVVSFLPYEHTEDTEGPGRE